MPNLDEIMKMAQNAQNELMATLGRLMARKAKG